MNLHAPPDETVKFRLELETAFKKEWSIEDDRR